MATDHVGIDALARRVSRKGIKYTGTCGAGLLRYLQWCGITVLEVTTSYKSLRRKRGKTTIHAKNDAYAANEGVRTVTQKTRTTRLRLCVFGWPSTDAARRLALQMTLNPNDLCTGGAA